MYYISYSNVLTWSTIETMARYVRIDFKSSGVFNFINVYDMPELNVTRCYNFKRTVQNILIYSALTE